MVIGLFGKFNPIQLPWEVFTVSRNYLHVRVIIRLGEIPLKQDVFYLYREAVVRMSSVKNFFLEISQNPQENTCARDSFFSKDFYQKRVSGTGVFLWILRNF